MRKIKGLLIDLDGVIFNDTIPIPGAAETIEWLGERQIPYRFITNTTMKSRATLQAKLASMGIEVMKENIFSAAYAAAQYVRQKENATCHLLLLDDAKKEYHDLESTADQVDFVVVGDIGEDVSFEMLNNAFLKLQKGAKLIALQKGRFWLSDEGYKLDAGAFVALLEYAANTESIIIGKPAKPFFEMALKDIQLEANQVAMIGDDLESDIAGAAQLGIYTCLVKTGKFRQEDLNNLKIQPDLILSSIADLPESNLL